MMTAAAAAAAAVDAASLSFHATTTTTTNNNNNNNACGGCGGGGCGSNIIRTNKMDTSSTSTTTTTTTTSTTILATLLYANDWTGALARIATHPNEVRIICTSDEYRTALHVACHEDAPAVVIAAILRAYPQAVTLVGTSNMTPLHITCSSHHASVHVVRVLLELGNSSTGTCGGQDGRSSPSSLLQQLQMRDVDGDTALHAACRCGAPIEVLQLLLQANPTAVHERDYEGLTPLLRLWVRYFVILGKHVIENYTVSDLLVLLLDNKNSTSTATVQGGGGGGGHLLAEAWSKTKLLLFCAHHGCLLNNIEQQDDNNNNTILHAAVAVDCPRPVVRIAATVHSRCLCHRDKNGLVPLHIACLAPIYKIRDLSDDGYTLEDQIHDYTNNNDSNENENNETTIASSGRLSGPQLQEQQQQQPSVIEILLQAAATRQEEEESEVKASSLSSSSAAAAASSAAAVICMMTDPLGRLPLHLALSTGKRWHYDGVKQLVEANTEAVGRMDPTCRLYPFMMAAAVSASTKGNSNNNNNASNDDDDESLNTAFELLRCNPTVLSDIITGKKKL